jgi:hypothetical protein
MAMKLHFASLSLGASVDQQTGNLSVFDVVDEVRTPQLPIQIQQLVISLSLEKTTPGAASGKMFIHVITPDRKQALVGSGEMAVPPEQRRMKAVFRLGGFPISQFGPHRFVLSWLNAQGTKEGEAILDFDAIQVTQVAQGMDSGQKPEFPN